MFGLCFNIELKCFWPLKEFCYCDWLDLGSSSSLLVDSETEFSSFRKSVWGNAKLQEIVLYIRMLVILLQFGIYQNCPIYLSRLNHSPGPLDCFSFFLSYLDSSLSTFRVFCFLSCFQPFPFYLLDCKLANILKSSFNLVFFPSYCTTISSFSLLLNVLKAVSVFAISALSPHIFSLNLCCQFLPFPFHWNSSHKDPEWQNPGVQIQGPFLSSHSAPLQYWTVWLLLPWNSSFAISLYSWLAAYLLDCLFNRYLLSRYYESGTLQVLGLSQWIRQTNPCSDGAYISARVPFTASYFLTFPQPQAFLRICPCLPYFICGMCGGSYIFWFS